MQTRTHNGIQIYLFIINFVKRQGCTEGQACNRTPYTHTYNTKIIKNYMEKAKNNTKPINLKIHKKIHIKKENDEGLHRIKLTF